MRGWFRGEGGNTITPSRRPTYPSTSACAARANACLKNCSKLHSDMDSIIDDALAYTGEAAAGTEGTATEAAIFGTGAGAIAGATFAGLRNIYSHPERNPAQTSRVKTNTPTRKRTAVTPGSRTGKRQRTIDLPILNSPPPVRRMPTPSLYRAPGWSTKTKRTRLNNQLGRRPGKYRTRRTMYAYSANTDEDKRLYAFRLVKIPWSNDQATINTRHAALCNVRGVKVKIWFQMANDTETSAVFDRPIQVRWAVINPEANDGSAFAVTPPDFFVDANPATKYETDFPPTGTTFNYMSRKINRSDYGVLKEGTFVIHQDPASTQTRMSMKCFKYMTFFIPIRRQMEWVNNSAALDKYAFPDRNLQFCYWYCQMGDKQTAQQYPTAAAKPFSVQAEISTYFHNGSMYK